MLLSTTTPWLATLLVAGLIAPAAPRGTTAPVLQPDKVVILSTTDVKGKSSPCGCSIPKGGLSRQASFADSMRSQYSHVLWVDNGGYFPDDSLHIDYSWFLMDGMKMLGVNAVGVGDRDLRFGIAYLKAQVKRTGLPVVCANLMERRTKAPVFPPYRLEKVGGATVGFLALMSDKVDLGPARDSLAVMEPQATAQRMVAEMKKKGATVIVLMSQLGKVETEDLVTVVEGIDAAIAGRNVPVLQKGRLVKNTVIGYGGEQGQYFSRTLLTIGPGGRATQRENDVLPLSPEVGEHPEVQQLVKAFEDKFNEKLREYEKTRAAEKVGAAVGGSPDRFVGNDVCARCHTAETAQWKTTAHAHAWKTLVDLQKDNTADCVTCHVVGNGKPGGFVNARSTPSMTDVGCESCHGMGSQHEAFTTQTRRITEATCRQCHTDTTSPSFSFATYAPHVTHDYTGVKPKLPAKTGGMSKMGAAGAH